MNGGRPEETPFQDDASPPPGQASNAAMNARGTGTSKSTSDEKNFGSAIGGRRLFEKERKRRSPMTQDATGILEPFRKYLKVLAELHLDRKLRGKLDPSDVVQQTMLRAYSALGELRDPRPEVLVAWLRRILARTLADAAKHYERDKRDAATGQPIGKSLQHRAEVEAVAFSPDGKIIITGSRDKTARLWDAATGQPTGKAMEHRADVTSVAFSPDGKTIVTGSRDKTAQLWDAATGQPLGPPLQHAASFGPAAVRPEDVTFYISRRMGGHPRANGVSVAFSPDGKTVLTGSVVGTTAYL